MNLDWFSNFQYKSTLSGSTIQQQNINIKNNFFNSTFKNSPMYFSVGLGSVSNLYDSLISSEDAYKKLINQKKLELAPGQDLSLFFTGQYVYWNNEVWLITSSDKRPPNNPFCLIERCDSLLKWVDFNGVIQSYNCVISDKVQREYLKNSPIISVPEGYVTIKLKRDVNTNLIEMNQRFLFGTLGNYTAYKVDFVKNYFDFPYLELVVYKDLVNSAIDDITNGVANNNLVITPIIITTGDYILPNVTSIIQNTSQTYNVYHYLSGVADANTFSIVPSGASSAYYTLQIIDGNHFSITSLGYTSTKLLVTCTNVVDATSVTISIQLRGVY